MENTEENCRIKKLCHSCYCGSTEEWAINWIRGPGWGVNLWVRRGRKGEIFHNSLKEWVPSSIQGGRSILNKQTSKKKKKHNMQWGRSMKEHYDFGEL